MSGAQRRSPLAAALVWLLRAYRFVVSPLYGQTCRYHPTCSAYALGAVEQHGGVRGAWLAARRLGRCHPWTAGGLDPVPLAGHYRWWGRVLPAVAEWQPAPRTFAGLGPDDDRHPRRDPRPAHRGA